MEPDQPSPRQPIEVVHVADPPLAKRSAQIWLGVIAGLLFALQVDWLIPQQQDTELDTNLGPSVAPAAEAETKAGPGSFAIQIDINTAVEREISLLPSVGPILAKRIVANRDENGPFVSLDDLMRVHGIGEKKLDQMSLYCVVKNRGT